MKTTLWAIVGTLIFAVNAWAVPVVVQVNGPDGKPVAGAEVRALRVPDTDEITAYFSMDELPRETARTDDKGVARFDWPEPKNSRVMPGTDRKMMGSATAWAPGFGASNKMLMQGDNSIKLAAEGVARGLVRDAAGAPIAGAKVRAMSVFGASNEVAFDGAGALVAAPTEMNFVATTDAQGEWKVGGLPLGTRAVVQLDDDRFAVDSAFAMVSAANGPTLAAPPLPAGIVNAINQSGELKALPASTLTGRVLDDKGAPVAGVIVWARSAKNDSQPYMAPKMWRTDAQGQYRVERLKADTYRVILRPPTTSPLVAGNTANVSVKVESGQTATLPEQKLIVGGTIALQVLDAKTGKPISGANAMAQPTDGANVEMLASSTTDADGKLQLHVAAGTYNVATWQAPSGYIAPARNGVETTKVAQGETQAVVWKLQPGLTAKGRIVAAGSVAPADARIYLQLTKAENGPYNSAIQLNTDDKGAWKTSELQAGQYKVALYGNEKWELIGPKTIDIPTNADIEISVKPITQTTLSGRVVDTVGNGVAGAKVSANVMVQTDNEQTNVPREAVSDDKGNYTLPEFPAAAKTITISVARDGYAPTRAPETKPNNEKWSVADAVLQALSAHLSGTVVDAQNVPQKGVQVLATRLGATAVSDENGAWKFDALAPGDTEIVAVGATGAVEQTVGAGRDNLQLKLHPFAQAPERDVDAARAVLDDAWQTSKGRKYYNRNSLPATLAPYDADEALNLARGADGKGKADDAAVVEIVQKLARTDAQRAREWAPDVIKSLEQPESKLTADLALAQALAPAHPDEAKNWLEQSRALFDKAQDWQKITAATSIATISDSLKLPDAAKWFEQALSLTDKDNNSAYYYSTLAARAATVNADWAQQAIEAAIKAAPKQPEYSQGPEASVGSAIRRLATWNLDAAQKLLDKYSALKGRYNSDYEIDRAKATIIIERFRKDGNLDAALVAGRGLNSSKIRALSQIAAIAPEAKRADILREALKLGNINQYQRSTAARIAWQLLPLDRETAKTALDEIRPSFDTYDANRDRYNRATDVAWWAFAYRGIDMAQSRWLLEREWARLMNDPNIQPNEEWNRANQLQNLVTAMATLDVPRAQQLIFALPVDQEGGAPFAAARILGRWMLANKEERQTRAFDTWDDSNFGEDGLDNNVW